MESGSGDTASVHDPYSTDSGSDYTPNKVDVIDDSSSDCKSVVTKPVYTKKKRKRSKSKDITESLKPPSDDNIQLKIQARIANNAILDGKFFVVKTKTRFNITF